MTFQWPELLWLLAAVPLLVAGYLWMLRRKKKAALAYANLNMVREAMGARQRFRRHIPPLLFLLSLITMIVAVARAAARSFIADQPANARIGVVSFAATASVVQPPTENREEILAAIDRFQLQRGTAVGSGILVSLKTIFPDVEFDLRSWNPRGDSARDRRRGIALDPKPDPAPGDPPKP